jgi:glyoxylase-like metal-dependent hydrolase (beta-lactamase superfamily II)
MVVALTALSLGATAQDSEEESKLPALIDAVVAAYGGDALTGIRNYTITERYIAPATGQSWTPHLDNVGATNQTFTHDLEGGRLYFENWFYGRGGYFANATIVNGDGAWAINPMASNYGIAANSDPYTIAGGTLRTTDALLALELHKARDKATYLGSENYMNRPHEKVQMPFPQSPDLTLYIDAQTGLISRMSRENPQLGLLDYVFNGHTSKNGITRATSSNFFIAGRPNLIGSRRQVSFNQRLDADLFTLPQGLAEEGERLDVSETVVNKLSNEVYHIGQGAGFTLFVDTGNGIVAAGGYPGLTQRLQRFREETGNHQPLAYQVVTHHHQDHLGGIGEALDLDARLVTVADNVETIKQTIRRDPESSRFLTVKGRVTLGSGKNRVEVYEVSTLHAASYLLVYAPGSRTLFTADHFGSPYIEGTPLANGNTVSLHAALAPLKLNYTRIVTAHGGRVFTARDFEKSVDAYKPAACPPNYPLCPTRL